jgi:hypothetical protein
VVIDPCVWFACSAPSLDYEVCTRGRRSALTGFSPRASQRMGSSQLWRNGWLGGAGGWSSGDELSDGPPVATEDAVCCRSGPLGPRECTPIPRTNHVQTIKKA